MAAGGAAPTSPPAATARAGGRTSQGQGPAGAPAAPGRFGPASGAPPAKQGGQVPRSGGKTQQGARQQPRSGGRTQQGGGNVTPGKPGPATGSSQPATQGKPAGRRGLALLSRPANVASDGGGLVLALFAYPVAANALRGGFPQAVGWLRAKFFNEPYGAPAPAGAAQAPQAGAGHPPGGGRRPAGRGGRGRRR